MLSGLVDRLKALRNKPKAAGAAVVAVGVAVVLVGSVWRNRSPEIWVELTPAEMRLAVGASETLSVALKSRPRFRSRSRARSIAGTLQLISFPAAVDVAPTFLVTSGDTPEAVLRVTGLRPGVEELIMAGSNTPAEERSWQMASMRVVVVGRQ